MIYVLIPVYNSGTSFSFLCVLLVLHGDITCFSTVFLLFIFYKISDSFFVNGSFILSSITFLSLCFLLLRLMNFLYFSFPTSSSCSFKENLLLSSLLLLYLPSSLHRPPFPSSSLFSPAFTFHIQSRFPPLRLSGNFCKCLYCPHQRQIGTPPSAITSV